MTKRDIFVDNYRINDMPSLETTAVLLSHMTEIQWKTYAICKKPILFSTIASSILARSRCHAGIRPRSGIELCDGVQVYLDDNSHLVVCRDRLRTVVASRGAFQRRYQ